jgi:ribosomal protein L7/L12
MTDPETLKRIGELERKVDHLMAHLTGATGSPAAVPPLPTGVTDASPAVLELVQRGDMIGAIKQYRAETGTDLATAKDRVEKLVG